jgi:hypothetical protein
MPLVHSAVIENVQTFQQRVSDARQTIRNLSGTSESVQQSMIRRVQVCIDSGGRYFEQLC